MFSAYRRDDFADPEGFVAQLGTVLSDFPEDVVTYVTSPKTGLQRRSKWPPTLSEVLEACQQHQDYLERTRKARTVQQWLPPGVEVPEGSWANFFVPADHPKYEKLAEWAKNNDPKWSKPGKSSEGKAGIWVPLNLWEGRDPTQQEENILKRL